MKKILLPFLVLTLCTFLSQAQSEATYSVQFTSNWTQAAHPHSSGSLPGNAHWSKLVGATHNDEVIFLEMGSLASPGVENIAEMGSNTVFFSEVNTAIASNYANAIIDGNGLSTAEGQITIDEITTSENYPLLTLLSMIAPSPDWMIAVNSVSLLDTNGDWIDQLDIDLYPYDAGTDSGVDYTSPNNDTDPQEPISSLQGITPFSNEIIGTFSISLQSILALRDDGLAETVLFPNPAGNTVHISNTNSIKSVSFYNVLGTEVLTVPNINGTSKQVDISALPSGIYLVNVQNDSNDGSVKRLVKL